MSGHERREGQRLKLSRPILGSIAGRGALILDLGLGGAFLEHYGIGERGDQLVLEFPWEGIPLEFLSEVAHSVQVRVASDGSPVSHTGVKFLEAVGDAGKRLEDLVATFVARVIAAERANAGALVSDAGSFLLDIGHARRTRTRGFVTFQFAGENWSRVASASSLQPRNGFTVPAHEDEEQLALLCDAYIRADEQGRDLIRMMAELSGRSVRH